MVKHRKSRRRSPRRSESRRSRGFTLHRGIKLIVAFGPVAGEVGSTIAANPNADGLRQASGVFSSAYSGYDISTGQFVPGNLIKGYLPLGAAWFLGKAMKRAGV